MGEGIIMAYMKVKPFATIRTQHSLEIWLHEKIASEKPDSGKAIAKYTISKN
jgi:hypothetical protein